MFTGSLLLFPQFRPSAASRGRAIFGTWRNLCRSMSCKRNSRPSRKILPVGP